MPSSILFTAHGANAGIFTANMYLAEDRILCFELVAKRNCRWVLQYVKSSTGETDVPEQMAEFILQRRRWLNGSFFAAVYALAHFYQVYRTDHSFTRKLMFMVEFFYQTINMVFAWFAIVSLELSILGLPDLNVVPGQFLSRFPHPHQLPWWQRTPLYDWHRSWRRLRMVLFGNPTHLLRPCPR